MTVVRKTVIVLISSNYKIIITSPFKSLACVPSPTFLCTNAAFASLPPSVASPSHWNFLKYALIGDLTEGTAFASYDCYGLFSFVSILLFISI